MMMKNQLLFILFLAICQVGLENPAAAQVAKQTLDLKILSPLNMQVVQRSSATGGEIIVAGWVAPLNKDAEVPASIEVRLVRDGAGEEEWQSIPYDPRVPFFHGTIKAPAGGWYKLEMSAVSTNKVLAQAEVPRVGVGEVFVVAGQSNSANHGELKLTVQEKVVTFTGTEWKVANDPQPGASGGGGSFIPAFGDAMAKRYEVPIGIIACGVGATSVREWLPRGVPFANPPTLVGHVVTVGQDRFESDGVIYDSFISRLQAFGKHGFRAVLWHQGESDANQRLPDRTLRGAHYTQHLQQLIEHSQQACGWKIPWFVAQASYHTPDDPGSEDIRAAQKAVWDAGIAFPGPNTDTLTGSMRDSSGKGVHFSAAGLQAHGRLWVEKVAPWLDKELQKATP